MSLDHSLEELRQAVSERPDDLVSLRLLVDALLDHGRAEEAMPYFEILVGELSAEPSVLALGVQIHTLSGDHLQTARYKKRLRQAIADSLEDDEDEDDDWETGVHPSHPSQETTTPHLRLLHAQAGDPAALLEPVRRLEDIAGLATVRRHLAEILDHAQQIDADRQAWTGGALFYGPPSCGKAFLGEVIAREIGAALWYVDIATQHNPAAFMATLEEVLTHGEERRLTMYFDNLDADPDGRIVADRRFLRLLDDLHSSAVVVLGAATMPWQVHPEIVRPGRLGRVLLVLPPDAPARETFLRERLERRSVFTEEELVWMIKRTEGHSFGDLQRLIDVAGTIALAADAPMSDNKPVLDMAAIRKARQRVGPSSSEWLTTAGHHAIMNEQGGLYDDLLQYFRNRERRS